MKRIVSVVVLACLSIGCVPMDKQPEPQAVQADGPANAWRPDKKPSYNSAPPASAAAVPQAQGTSGGAGSAQQQAQTLPQDQTSVATPGNALEAKWPSGEALQATIKDFLDSGFMKFGKPFAFGDLAYTDAVLDASLDDRGRIEQLDGAVSSMYDKYSYGIPVVKRSVDAISGSRQVNWEDVITTLDDSSWRIRPVCDKDGQPFDVILRDGIEFRTGSQSIRITKSGAVFTCIYASVSSGGQLQQRLSWSLEQYQAGPALLAESAVAAPEKAAPTVPVVMVWEPGHVAGYLVSLPEGRAEYVHSLRWTSSGNRETDRYNFLVLLTQDRGYSPRIPDSLGAVDPVWLALLMYDYVVGP
jgi:hypothetical protein